MGLEAGAGDLDLEALVAGVLEQLATLSGQNHVQRQGLAQRDREAGCTDDCVASLFVPAMSSSYSGEDLEHARAGIGAGAEQRDRHRGALEAEAPTGMKAIVGSEMGRNHITRRIGLAALVLTPLLALISMAGQAAGYSPGCGQIPIVGGIPPWGFHTGPPIGETGSFARGHGQINLEANTVSGILCQEDRGRNQPTRAITMTVEHHLVYHSHYAVMWGFPGNIMKIILRVRASNDPKCKVGTVGRATLFASYNGVRSDSVQFTFPAACKDHDHLYHGPQVNNQVPPL